MMMENLRISAAMIPWLSLILVISLAYSLLLPPFEAPDEPAHFLRAYGIAEGEWVLEDHPAKVVVFIKQSLERFRGRESARLLSLMGSDLREYGDRIPNLAYNSSLYSPVPYLPYAIVIKVLGLLGDSEGVLYASLYLCRIVSILVFLALFAFATSLCPGMDLAFFWTMATPMALAQIGVVSTDYALYGASLVVLAGASGQGKNRAWAMAGYAASVIVLLATKITYLPLLLIPLAQAMPGSRETGCCGSISLGNAVPGRRGRFPGDLIVIVGSLLAGLTGAALWNMYAARVGIFKKALEVADRITGYTLVIDPGSQIRFILHHPLDFLQVISHTLTTRGVVLLHQFVGVLGWLDLPIPTACVWLWGLGVLVVLLASNVAGGLSPRSRFLAGSIWLAGAMLTFIALCASAYIVWMPPGSASINLQGRYLQPIAAAFLVGMAFLRPFEVKRSLVRISGHALAFLAVMINLFAIYSVVARYGLWWLGRAS